MTPALIESEKMINHFYRPVLFRRARLILLLAGSLALAPWIEAKQWEIIRLQGRDYVPVENVGAFYSLGSELRPAENRVSFIAEHADLQFQAGARDVQINGVRHWLGFAPFDHEGRLLVSRIDLVKTLEPALRPNAVPELLPIRTVVLDAGHGGQDHGATSSHGDEKDFNLDVCLQAAQLLRDKGFEVVLTRDKDVFIPLEERAAIANKQKDAILVSVHFNDSADNPEANGFEVFALTPRGAPSTADMELQLSHLAQAKGNANDSLNLVLATTIQHSVLGNMPQFDRGVKRARFAVLKLAQIPAVLVEGGFLSNATDSELAANASWRKLLAEAITAGIVDYRKLAQTRRVPKMVADYRLPAMMGSTLTTSVDVPSPLETDIEPKELK